MRGIVGKLKVEFVQRPPRLPIDREPDVVEVYVGACGKKIDLCIWRHGLFLRTQCCGALGNESGSW